MIPKFNKEQVIRRMDRAYGLLKPMLDKRVLDQLDIVTKNALIDSSNALEHWRITNRKRT